MKRKKSEALFEKAKDLFPGGVNSPVRAFRSVGGTPIFIQRGDGCRIWDADDNEYIDFCGSWGPLIHGHNNPVIRKRIIEAVELGTTFGAPTELENTLAELILSNHRFIEKIRFVSSGTEAVMSALRLARGFTGKDKIIKFDGCYHGHTDSLLVKAGSGLATFGVSSSAGVPASFAADTLVLPLYDIKILEETLAKQADQVACVIIEPIPANNGLLLQTKKYLQALRNLCTKHGVLLIFDEVISGFRVGFEGAAGVYGIAPDIMTYGKIIGGGMPVGAYGASKAIMSKISPEGDVYQAGTLSGNPVAMSAGIAALRICLQPGFYKQLAVNTRFFINSILQGLPHTHTPFRIHQFGSIFWFSFSDAKSVRTAGEIDAAGMPRFNKMYHMLLEKGVYMGPSGYEVGFVSAAHSKEDLQEAAKIYSECLGAVLN